MAVNLFAGQNQPASQMTSPPSATPANPTPAAPGGLPPLGSTSAQVPTTPQPVMTTGPAPANSTVKAAAGAPPQGKAPAPAKSKAGGNKRVRNLIVFGFLAVAIVAALAFVILQTNLFTPQADVNTEPRNLRTTNITDTGFTVTFLTSDAVAAYVQYATSPDRLKNQATEVYGDRDQADNNAADQLVAYQAHQVTLKNLSPQTTYYFRIVVKTGNGWGANQIIYEGPNDAPFEIKTNARSTVNNNASLFGTIVKNARPLGGALVYAEVNNSSYLSSYTTPDGKWRLDLNYIYDQATKAPMTLNDSDSVKFTIVEADSGATKVLLTTYAAAKNGLEIDLLKDDNQLGGTTPTPDPEPTAGQTVDLTSDTLQVVDTNTPTLVGQAQPDQPVVVTVTDQPDSDIVEAVTADGTGRYQLDISQVKVSGLNAGNHTVTTDASALSVNFVVNSASGVDENPPSGSSGLTAEDVYGSGNPVSEVTPTPSPSPIPSPTPTPTPTPTPSPSPSPEPEPEPEPITTPAPVPESGSTQTTLFLLLAGLFFICIGTGSYLLIKPDPQD